MKGNASELRSTIAALSAEVTHLKKHQKHREKIWKHRLEAADRATVLTGELLDECQAKLEAAEDGWRDSVNRQGKALQRAYRAEQTIKEIDLFADDMLRNVLVEPKIIGEQLKAIIEGKGD